MLDWKFKHQELRAVGQYGEYCIEAVTALAVKTNRGEGIALYVKRLGGINFIYRSTHKSIWAATQAAEQREARKAVETQKQAA